MNAAIWIALIGLVLSILGAVLLRLDLVCLSMFFSLSSLVLSHLLHRKYQ